MTTYKDKELVHTLLHHTMLRADKKVDVDTLIQVATKLMNCSRKYADLQPMISPLFECAFSPHFRSDKADVLTISCKKKYSLPSVL